MSENKLIIIANNLRSSHNVGSLLRTCDGLGVSKLYLCGYTPYPMEKNDSRLPHIAQKIDRQIIKTALGAEKSLAWERHDSALDVIVRVRESGYEIIALEQTSTSIDLDAFKPGCLTALVIGREVDGLESEVLEQCDRAIEIPMLGKKESFNVVIAAAIAGYVLKHKG